MRVINIVHIKGFQNSEINLSKIIEPIIYLPNSGKLLFKFSFLPLGKIHENNDSFHFYHANNISLVIRIAYFLYRQSGFKLQSSLLIERKGQV